MMALILLEMRKVDSFAFDVLLLPGIVAVGECGGTDAYFYTLDVVYDD